jgi:HD-GYP domain-containing protein (c-di-GMP phosphodiesterase class II)
VMTVSGGVAAFPEHGATQDELVRLASGALRQAREEGGDRIMAWSGSSADPQTERRDVERAMRAVESTRGHSAASRAVSDYAGHIAGVLGLDPDRVDRVRLAAFLYDTTVPGGDVEERARIAARVTANALDDEAAAWLLARPQPIAEAPLETRVMAVAEAFVAAGGQGSDTDAGRALAELWPRAGSDLDESCLRALERLLAA